MLVGSDTAGRKWISYEIDKSWDDGEGVLGIYVHNLFETFTAKWNGPKLSCIVRTYDPPFFYSSTDCYNPINLP